MTSQINQSLMQSGPLIIQPGQSISQQTGTLTNLQPGSTNQLPHQNLQVWGPGPGGAVNISSLSTPRGHPNMVTLPSGQTVLMTNLVTTANNPPIPLPASSPLPKVSSIQSANPMMISSHTPPLTVSMTADHLAMSTVIQGPNGPISVALPGGIIPNSSMTTTLTAAPTTYVSAAPGLNNTDQTGQIPQYIEQTCTNQSSFPSATFQTVLPSGQVVVSHTGVGLHNSQAQPTRLTITTVPTQSPLTPTLSTQSFMNDLTTEQVSINSALPSGDTLVQMTSTVSKPSNTFSATTAYAGMTDANLPNSSMATGQQLVTSTNNPAMNISSISGNALQSTSKQVVQSGTTALRAVVSTTSGLTSCDPQSFFTNQPKEDSSDLPSSVFTPASLTQLLADLDPQLQLDPDTQEVLVNLASEFVTSVATKAQKLAVHRGSSNVEAKDIHFCLERDWDISLPGYSCEQRSLKQNILTEAHKQRLSLIKKQIKKM
ncbi:hypothetical protein EG68_03290 [Paragonimus skrjabini miyazakii]|uniref:Transcription initiation factor TFIID subunit 12 n=1 Tax=Paragonimus skrjabini miyazakii TaxID=59628 RepID=A0A8S9Z155_9TREM|nr:hypothetical protein EG68_03290 [Paragonimus skrjabini miyazakii]